MNRLAAAGLALAVTAAIAQERAPHPRFRAGVTFVEVDVSVLDRDRRPVSGLGAADFVLTEDGAAQKIVTFEEVNVPAPPPPAVPWMREVAPDVRGNDAVERRLFVLVLDDAQAKMDPAMTARVKDIGRRIVDQLGPNDLAAVVFTQNNSGAQDFTNDRARLLRAVARFAPGITPAEPLPLPEIPRSGMVSSDTSGTYFQRSSMATLRKVSEYLAAVQRKRKALIYVSPGVPVDYTVIRGPGTELAADAKQILEAAARANVNIYALDPTGLALDEAGRRSTAHESAATPFALKRQFLQSLAADTGGLAVLDRNDFAASVPQIFRETGSYYLLGYESPNAKTDGRFRRIDVRVNRPRLSVRARRGYYSPKRGKSAESEPSRSTLDDALSGLLPQPDVALQAFAAPFALTGRREAALAIVVGLIEPTTPDGARKEETIELLASAYGPEGEFKGSTREKARYAPEPGAGRIEHEFLSRLDLKPGRYSVRIAAKSAALGKSGSVFYDVDVPDFSRERLSLSGLVLSATPAPPVVPRDRLAALLPVIPTTRREFGAGDQVAAFLRIYQGGKAPARPVALAVRVTDRAGATVLDMPQTIASDLFTANRAANVRFDVPLERLAPGPWLLTVEAGGPERTLVRRDVRFVVR